MIIAVLLLTVSVWFYLKINRLHKDNNDFDNNDFTQVAESKHDWPESKNAAIVISEKEDSLNGSNQLIDTEKRVYTVSEYNTDLDGHLNIKRPEKSKIINPTIDTNRLFKIWTLNPNGPDADFWFKRNEFLVVDYDGDGAMPYILSGDSLTVYYNDFIQKGKIMSVSQDNLIIYWSKTEEATKYVEWKN